MSFNYKIVAPILLLVVLAVGVFYITDGFKKNSPIGQSSSSSSFGATIQPSASARPGSVDQVCFKNKCFVVELAQTIAEQSRGLMFRDHLDSNKGMLFVFDSSAIYNFWMKNTEIPLDIIWLDKNGLLCETPAWFTKEEWGQYVYLTQLNPNTCYSFNFKLP